MSGSSIANTVTTGTFTIPLMKEKQDLKQSKQVQLKHLLQLMGQLMPPIMGAAAFIMAEFLGYGLF